MTRMQINTAITPAFRQDERVVALSTELNIPPLLAAMLVLRGQDSREKAEHFLYPDSTLVNDPFLMKDLRIAAERVAEAVRRKEKILIYGDYDVDGISSTALLYRYFRSYGISVSCRIPDRHTEGYGISEKALDDLEKDIDLIVTVDTGSTALKEIEYAKALGYEVVVTDHHECRELLPECTAVVNPMRPDCDYPFKGLAGVGVAFKLVCAVEQLLSPGKMKQELLEELMEEYLPFVTLGTVADVMPLTDENRYFVKKGLEMIPRFANPGIRALCTQTNKGKMPERISSATVGYILAPNINAAGRMGSAVRALELLISDLPVEADVIADELCKYNVCRRREETLIMAEVNGVLNTHEYDHDPVLVLSGDNWHEGVIGIVASRVTEQTGRPTILITLDGENGKGSGRSIAGVNLVELLTACSTHLTKYGGHEMAAGLSLQRSALPAFRKAINEAYLATAPLPCEPILTVDAEPSVNELNVPLADALSLLEPCGCGNTFPVFLMRDAWVSDILPLSGGKHSKMTVEKEGIYHTVLLFGQQTELFPVGIGEKIDFVYSVSVNEYNGRRSLQLQSRKLFPKKNEREEEILSALERKDYNVLSEFPVPSRAVQEAIYKQFVMLVKSGVNCFSVPYRASLLPTRQTTAEYMIVCGIFKELGLIEYQYNAKDRTLYAIGADLTKRVSLADSALYTAMKKE